MIAFFFIFANIQLIRWFVIKMHINKLCTTTSVLLCQQFNLVSGSSVLWTFRVTYKYLIASTQLYWSMSNIFFLCLSCSAYELISNQPCMHERESCIHVSLVTYSYLYSYFFPTNFIFWSHKYSHPQDQLL